MRRHATLPFLLMLGLVFAIGMTPSLLADEGTPAPFGEGLQITEGKPQNPDSRTAAYSVLFDHGAYVNEEASDERTASALVVKVLSGTFALRVQGDFYVDPQDQDIQILSSDIDYGKPVTRAHDFTSAGAIANDSCPGVPPRPADAPPTTGKTMCLLNPAVLGSNELFVKLDPGFAVYLPPNSECFFCNMKGITGDKTNTADRGELLVWAPRGAFTWQTKSHQSLVPGSSAPSASMQDLHDAVGWTVLRNPGSPCH